ncbi:unnamed protein product [Ascophyllum nodosum]
MSSVGRQGHDVGKNADSGSTLDRFFFGWRWRRPTMEEDKRPQGVPDDGLVAIEKRTEVEKAVEVDLERGNNRGKKIIGLVIACIVIAVIVDLLTHNNVKSWLEEALEWIERNPWSGSVVFALIFCAATLMFIPGLILTIGAGVAFGRAFGFVHGLVCGTLSVLVGAFAACVIAFYMGRYAMHDYVQNYSKRYRVLGAVNKAIETNGIKVMFLLRLSPIVPFSGFNMIAGVTKASFRDYLVGCLGIVPGTIAFVFIGASTAGTMHEEERMDDEGVDMTACIIRMTLFIVGSVAAVVALIAVTVYARRALKEALEDSDEEARTDAMDIRSDLDLSRSQEFKFDTDSNGSQCETERSTNWNP